MHYHKTRVSEAQKPATGSHTNCPICSLQFLFPAGVVSPHSRTANAYVVTDKILLQSGL